MHATALRRLARAYEKQGRYQLVVETYGRLARAHPPQADEAWFRSGEIYRRRLKDVTQARATYAKVSVRSEYFTEARKHLNLD